MVWAACLALDAVSLQKLPELLGTVAWTIVTLDYMRQTQLSDNHSMHMAVEEELGNFLTMMYLEKTSATRIKSILFQWSKSVANVCHGNGGSS